MIIPVEESLFQDGSVYITRNGYGEHPGIVPGRYLYDHAGLPEDVCKIHGMPDDAVKPSCLDITGGDQDTEAPPEIDQYDCPKYNGYEDDHPRSKEQGQTFRNLLFKGKARKKGNII